MQTRKPIKNILPVVTAAAIAALGAGCSKPAAEEEQPPTPVVPRKLTAPATAPTSATAAKAQPANERGVPFPPDFAPDSPAALQEIHKLEAAYLRDSDDSFRWGTISELTDVGGKEALKALLRLFNTEPDADLRSHIVNSLDNIEGFDDQKVALLTIAAGFSQPSDVRQSAIAALKEIDPKRALPILRNLGLDRDEDVRAAAKDAVEELESP